MHSRAFSLAALRLGASHALEYGSGSRVLVRLNAFAVLAGGFNHRRGAAGEQLYKE
jgi:hypothetical protein